MLSSSYYEGYMAKQDGRVSLTTECLNNIKMLKLYSWTHFFENMIKDKRMEELKQLKKMFINDTFLIAGIRYFPNL